MRKQTSLYQNSTLHSVVHALIVRVKYVFLSSVEIPNLLFPQAELVMEEEIQQRDTQAREKSESEKLKEYQDLLKTNTEIGAGLDKDELEKSAVSETEDDKQFAKFKARIATNPDQVGLYLAYS